MKKIHGHESSSRQRAADDEADGAAADRDRGPDAERLRALGALPANVVEMIASAAGEMNAAPRPCSARQPISIPGVDGEAVEQRRDREDDEAEEEEPLAAEQVAGAAAEQQEAAEDERVRVDDPLEVRLARARGLPGSTAARRSRPSRRG